jgi:hypothetical protein
MRKVIVGASLLIVLLALSTVGFAQSDSSKTPVTKAASDSSKMAEKNNSPEKIIASYFHGTRRCATCRKLEAYSKEAIETGFAKEIKDSTLVWRVVNTDEDANEHFVEDYGLYTKAVILSKVIDGKEVAWKNLDKIWDLVGDKEAYLKYIQTETADFIQGKTADE